MDSEAPAITIFNIIVQGIETCAHTREEVIKHVANCEHKGVSASLLCADKTRLQIPFWFVESIRDKCSTWRELGIHCTDLFSDFSKQTCDHVFLHPDLVGWAMCVRYCYEDKTFNITVYRLPFWRRWLWW